MNKISLFTSPISPFRDENGRYVAATVQPSASISLEALARLIRADEGLMRKTEAVRNDADIKLAKTRMLPYVTPFGTFSRRKSDALLELSGLIPIDIDGLKSPEEAAEMRDSLFEDKMLNLALAFVSPSRNGVKCFAPFPYADVPAVSPEAIRDIAVWQECLSDYIDFKYLCSAAEKVDRSGKDMARACFVCHDPDAKFRECVNLIVKPLI